jgi:predicted ATPase/Tfp pilus assembly protein PilF
LAHTSLDERADLHALGVLLYECLTGVMPYDGVDLDAVRTQKRDGVAPAAAVRPDVPAWMSRALERLLDPEPCRRFTHASELALVLEQGEASAWWRLGAPNPSHMSLSLELTPPHNLPRVANAFIGRTTDLAQVVSELGQVRLLALVGPPGSGKSRLLSEVARQQLAAFPGGAWRADLRDARTEMDVIERVAHALSLHLTDRHPAAQTGHALASRGRCLVLLDDADGALGAVSAVLQPWLVRAPQVVFAMTSRQASNHPSERIYRVEPLSSREGMELFVERARAVQPSFVVSPDVQELVELLDGLPLAIELAAARIGVLSPTRMLARIGDRLRLLSGPTRAEGHATVRAALDVSWELMSEWERAALLQCAVFPGSLSFLAAEEVLDLDAFESAPWPMDAVIALIERSLLRSWIPEGGHDPRLALYRSVREYALEHLARQPALEATARARHAHFFADLRSRPDHVALSTGEEFAVLADELDNLVEAARWLAVNHLTASAERAFRAASDVLRVRGPFSRIVTLATHLLDADLPHAAEARVRLTRGGASRLLGAQAEADSDVARALELARAAGDEITVGSALTELGNLAFDRGNMAVAATYQERAITAHRAAGQRELEAAALGNLGNAMREQGELERALEHYDAALKLRRATGGRASEGIVLGNVGNVLCDLGRVEEAEATWRSGLQIHRQVGNRHFEAVTQGYLGTLYRSQGRMDEARRSYETALEIHRLIGDRPFEGVVLGYLGTLHQTLGELGRARAAYQQALAVHQDVGDRWFAAIVSWQLGEVAAAQGHLGTAVSHHQTALDAHLELGNATWAAVTKGSLGRVARQQGALELSIAWLEEATAALDGRWVQAWGWMMASLAETRVDAGQTEQALHDVGRAVVSLRAADQRLELGGALCVQALALARSGQVKAAKHVLAEAMQMEALPGTELYRLLLRARSELETTS